MKLKQLQESEYIPLPEVLGATRFGVVPLRNIMLAKKLQQNRLAEQAANFRQQALFGNRVRRTPSEFCTSEVIFPSYLLLICLLSFMIVLIAVAKILAHQEKLKASGKDRLVTSKKN